LVSLIKLISFPKRDSLGFSKLLIFDSLGLLISSSLGTLIFVEIVSVMKSESVKFIPPHKREELYGLHAFDYYVGIGKSRFNF
jgi:hypothetical protein